MNIVHILTYSWENGGASKVVHDLALFQKKNGHDPVIISIDLEGGSLYKEIEGVEIIRIKAPFFSKFFPLFSYRLFQILQQRPFDIYHLHALWNFTLFACHWLKLWNKTIVSIHGSANPYTFKNNKFKRALFSLAFQRNFLRKVKYIHVFHSQERKYVIDYMGDDWGNILTIPTGLDTNIKLVDSQKRSLSNKVLYMSRLDPIKGLDLLLPAFELLSQKLPDVQLIIAGSDFGMQKFVEDFINNNSTLNIKYVGMASGAFKQQLLDEAGVFVLNSYSEGFSVAVLEALNQGIPVLVSTETGMSDEIRKYQAGRVTGFDVNEIADGLFQILSDKEKRNQYSINARTLVKQCFDIELVEKKLSDMYGFT